MASTELVQPTKPSTAYTVTKVLAGAVVESFFNVTWIGKPRIEKAQPTLVIANHPNSIVDPAILLTSLDREIGFMAKSTLFDNPIYGPALRSLGAVPAYRKMDGVDTSKNAASFDALQDRFKAGGCVGIFPEGQTYMGQDLLPFRSGAARICLQAQLNGVDVAVVPVFLWFDERGTWSSRVVAHAGQIQMTSAVLDRLGLEASLERPTVEAVSDQLFAALSESQPLDDRLFEVANDLTISNHGHMASDAEFSAVLGEVQKLSPQECAAVTDAAAECDAHRIPLSYFSYDRYGSFVAEVVVAAVVVALGVLYAPVYLVAKVMNSGREATVDMPYRKIVASTALYLVYTVGLLWLLMSRIGAAWGVLAVAVSFVAHISYVPAKRVVAKAWPSVLMPFRLRSNDALAETVKRARSVLVVKN